MIALLLVSCNPFPVKYPARIASLVTPNTSGVCPVIAGSYEDMGRSFNEEGEELASASLTHLLHPAQPIIQQVDVVLIKQSNPEFIEIESQKAGTTVVTLNRPQPSWRNEDRYNDQASRCEKGFIRLRFEEDFITLSPAPFAGYFSEDLWFAKSADGSLIMIQHHSSSGIAVLIPWGSSNITWYRFAPASTHH